MKPRHVVNAAAIGGLTVGYSVPALAFSPFAPFVRQTGPILTRIAQRWANRVLRTCNIDLVAEDFDRPLLDKAYLVLANHTSHFDVIAIYARFPRDLFPVAKRELGHIPVFGWALRSGAAVMVDRGGDRQRARASIEAAGAAIRAGRSVLMFPEGTRTPGTALGPFKKGPFYLALAAQVPVLPVAVLGASEVLRPHDWRVESGRTITVRMGRPIPTSDYGRGGAGRSQLSADVRGALERLIEARDPA